MIDAARELELDVGEVQQGKSGLGAHWQLKREQILAVALRVINNRPEGYSLFHGDNSINLAQLADAIPDHGHELTHAKNSKAISRDTIYDTIKRAIKKEGGK